MEYYMPVMWEEKSKVPKYKRIIYKPGMVTQIIMNRPERLNAISHPMYKELEDAFDRAAADPECRVIVHSGAGRSFCAGHDYVQTSPECKPMLADERPVEELIKQYGSEEAVVKIFMEQHSYFTSWVKLKKWRAIPQPTIAMVQGYCIYGGWFNAAAMDLVFASEDALFLPAMSQYDAGPWSFGERKFKELIFEHRFITAREAYECGFVNRIYPTRDILEKETLAFANRVAANNVPAYLRCAKQSINHTMDVQGFSASVEDSWIFSQLRDLQTTEAESATYSSGRVGVARSDVALANLKAKEDAQKKYYGK